MAILRHACAVLLSLVFLWARVALSAPPSSPQSSSESASNLNTTPEAVVGVDVDTQQIPPSVPAAKSRYQEIRVQRPDDFVVDDQQTGGGEPIVVPTEINASGVDGDEAAGHAEMSVVDLESKDGVDMPPQVADFVVNFYNRNSQDYEMVDDTTQEIHRVRRSGDQYLVGQVAHAIGQNGGSSHGGYGGSGSGYGQSYGGSGYGGYGQSYGGSGYGGSGQSGYDGSFSGGHGGSYGSGYGSSYGVGGGLTSGGSGGHSGYGKGLHLPSRVSYGHSYAKSPIISFVKGFKPGKTYVDKGHVIRNYFRHGTYNVALQHYKLIPTVKVVPYTTYKKIGVGQKVEAKFRYKAVICKYCYHGYPKIDVYEMRKPYSYAVRRFVYLPNEYNLNSHGSGSGQGGHGQGYGYGSQGYGYGGQGYGYGSGHRSQGSSYGGQSYGGSGYGSGNGLGSVSSFGAYGNGSGRGSHGNGGGYGGYGGGHAKVTYHNYYPGGNSGGGGGGYSNGGSGGYH